jgi:starch-binding outer membrane protein, SusD/RagB family
MIKDMKKYIYLFAILTILGVFGCKKNYLNLTNPDKLTTTNFYKTSAQFQQAANGAYQPLQDLYNGAFWAMGEMRSDNTSYEYDDQDRSGTDKEEIDEFRELNNNDIVFSFFSDSYVGIGRCNAILGRLPAAKIDTAIGGPVAGQAYFLRAFNYFNLVRMFGDIPLVLIESASLSDAFKVAHKSPAATIYTQIEKDALGAIQRLPVKYVSTSPTDTADLADKGRATKGTAETMLAEIYMTEKKFDLAIPLLQDVIASGAYKLNANYADNYGLTNENGPESIFEIQYIEGPNGLSSDFVDIFCPWDVYDDSVTGYDILNGASNGWNIPTQDMLDAYEPGDKRRAASLNEDFISDEWGYLVPYITKYNSKGAVQYQTGNNFPVYRYSDVYLMLAEALNEQGYAAGGDAFHYLNLVRERAGLADKTGVNVASQQDFRTAIYHERQVEFAFENHRWFDLLRTGQASAVMQAHAAREKAAKASYINSDAYSDIRLLYQYPLNEQILEH